MQVFLDLLISRLDIPTKYKNHKLKGNFKNRWECHIEPDWLLIYYTNRAL
jgi:mRNA interferase YafQ